MLASEEARVYQLATTGSAYLRTGGRVLTKYLALGVGFASNLLVSVKLNTNCTKGIIVYKR